MLFVILKYTPNYSHLLFKFAWVDKRKKVLALVGFGELLQYVSQLFKTLRLRNFKEAVKNSIAVQSK